MLFKEQPLRDLLEAQKEVDRLKKQLGSSLRSARLANGMTQAQVASSAGVTQAYVSMVESGDKTPSSDSLERFIEVLEGSSSGQDEGNEDQQD